MLISLLKTIIAKLQKQLKRLFTFKKICLIASMILSFYRFRSLPSVVSSFDFLKYLNSKECNISNMEIFLNKFILFKSDNCSYYTGFAITNQENFTNSLISKNIHFNYIIDEIQSLLLNPFNQFIFVFCFSGVLFADVMKDFYTKHFYFRRSRPSKVLSNDEYLTNFISKPEVKHKLSFFIDQIRYQEKYKAKGLKITRGLLLYGPPGTGKTLIARCLATINNVSFISRCASEFVEIYVGSGPKAIRDTFKEAKENKPAIIFIDELEAIGFQRSSSSYEYGNNLERYTALNQLLSEMDGLNENDDIIVVGATNRYDLLDEALVRQGRFSMKIAVDLPAEEERRKIFLHYLKRFNSDYFTEEDVKLFSLEAKGFSGADIEGVVNEAVSKALSEEKDNVDKEAIISLIRDNQRLKMDHQARFTGNSSLNYLLK